MKAESFFTVKGRRYRLLGLEELSFEEALELDRISGGMAPRQAIDAFADLHPRAVLAMLTVSMRRTKPQLSELELHGENLLDVMDTLETVGEDEASPPDEGGADPGAAAARSSSETTPGDAGTPAGSIPTSED